GAMLAVSLTEQEAAALTGSQLSLAAVNGPALCVLSGPVDEIEMVARKLDAGGAFSRRLHVSHALHSAMMEPVVAPFVALVAEVERRAPQIPYVSTLTGTWIAAAEATDPRYWGRHLRGTVRFAAGVTELLKEDGRVLLEVGPGQTLTSLVRQQAHGASAPRAVVASLRHPHEQQTTDTAFLLDTLAQLWLAGASVDWPALHAHAPRRRTPLPTYPFERARYWIEPPATTDATADLSRKSDPADWYYVPSWKRAVKPDAGVAASADGRAARWLVFTDEQGLGARVVSQLADAGADVTVVSVHTQFARFDERSFGLRPGARADYDALLKELRAAKRVPDRILHLWNVTA
ncbi:MAG TPA: acyltransferase domain-containing protein, partial [Pyrinomonadaceae bacterium]|nr:acyltransferase domain-containing protein [Pyrinomonadaceae bacterium]